MLDLPVAAQAFAIPPFMRKLSALVVALFDREGALLDANRGFRLIVAEEDDDDDDLAKIADVFMRPDLVELGQKRADPDRLQIFEGMVQLGRTDRTCRSLRGTVYRRDDLFLLVAEHDIGDLERLNGQLLELNEELAEMQRELARTNRRLRQREAELHDLARRDPLTGLANRLALNERLPEEIARSRRHDRPLGLIIADLDHFKRINDTFGHDVGDEVLKRGAGLLQENARGHDLTARIGGEEFLLLVPDTDLDGVMRLAERLRAQLAALDVPQIQGRLTASFGIASLCPGEDGSALLRRADQALYEAKTSGRNRVVAAPPRALEHTTGGAHAEPGGPAS